jgi:hypothetical protein
MLIPALLFAATALAGKSFADTSHTDQLPLSRPWPAPAGHHQPRTEDIDRSNPASSSKRQLQKWDRAIDGKLKICRGC